MHLYVTECQSEEFAVVCGLVLVVLVVLVMVMMSRIYVRGEVASKIFVLNLEVL